MIVSIHQPQYIPWPGYFYKILKSDVFVLYDTVQYPRGKHFGNRNQVKTANGPTWLTVPVLKRSDMLPYTNIPVDLPAKWATKHWRTIELSYGRAPHFTEIAGDLRKLYERSQWPNIAELNLAFTQFCLDALHSTTRIVRASELTASSGAFRGSDYILAILTEVGATQYISGQGAGSLRYIEPQSFSAAGIELSTYAFDSVTYPQLWGDFMADLSIIDMLANIGGESRARIEQAGKLSRWNSTLATDTP
ncbi:MAG: WbqC family protein [Gemmatimonadaceae bacterium]|nr:WbqC family protein [Gemmatimonadaceae bacterium]